MIYEIGKSHLDKVCNFLDDYLNAFYGVVPLTSTFLLSFDYEEGSFQMSAFKRFLKMNKIKAYRRSMCFWFGVLEGK